MNTYRINLPDGKYEYHEFPIDQGCNFYVVENHVLYEYYADDEKLHESDPGYESYEQDLFKYLGPYVEPEKTRYTPSYTQALACFMDGAEGEFIEQDFRNFIHEQVLAALLEIQENTDATIKQIQARMH